MPKAPSFQFYPGDWLKDPRLRRSSFRARGVWIDIMAIAFECPEKGILRDENGPFPEQEILDMLTGKARDKRAGFEELKRRKIIKQLPDNSYYCKRIYEDWRISDIRREAGKKGGNPSLLLKQNANQTDEQILTPSLSTSSSPSEGVSKDTPPNGGPSSKHFKDQVGQFYNSILAACEIISAYPPKNGSEPWNPYKWVQEKTNKKRHPGAIDQVVAALARKDIWDGIKKGPYAYANSILASVNKNWNEKDAIAIHEEMKSWDAAEFTSITRNIMERV